MWFVRGLMKSAAFDRHSDGSEFKIQDTEPAPYVAGVGGMSPSGFAANKPLESAVKKTPWKPEQSKKKAEIQRALDIAMLGKMAGLNAGECDGVGTSSQGAETLSSQLKYETTTDNITENMGYNKIKYQDSPLLKRLKKFNKGAKR
jgi:hypothetical protein